MSQTALLVRKTCAGNGWHITIAYLSCRQLYLLPPHLPPPTHIDKQGSPEPEKNKQKAQSLTAPMINASKECRNYKTRI